MKINKTSIRKYYFISTKNAYELSYTFNTTCVRCLYSYDTLIAAYLIKNGEKTVIFGHNYDYSRTTIQHLHKWFKYNDIPVLPVPIIRKNLEYNNGYIMVKGDVSYTYKPFHNSWERGIKLRVWGVI